VGFGACARVPRKLAFITGATAGIGASTARAFARAGYDLVITGRRDDRLQEMEDELRPLGGNVDSIPFDVRDAQALKLAQLSHPHLFEKVDVLVNNAGLAKGTEPLHEGDPDEWDEVIDTNVKALLRITRAILPHMVKRGSGHVVMLGSTAGHWVYPGGAVYCASKHAVRAITEGLRMDVHGSGVRVTSVDPGLVGGTEFSDVRFRGDHARARKVYEGLQPLSPDDVAETILWCVERPAHVNIQDIVLTPTAQASVTMVKRA
jgi:serine 3-dehydrogenase